MKSNDAFRAKGTGESGPCSATPRRTRTHVGARPPNRAESPEDKQRRFAEFIAALRLRALQRLAPAAPVARDEPQGLGECDGLHASKSSRMLKIRKSKIKQPGFSLLIHAFPFLAAVVAATCLTGCASSEVRVAAPLGPRPNVPPATDTLGALQVFTAAQLVAENVNFQEFFAGEPGLKECEDLAHSDYTLYSGDGRVLRRVKNASNSQDAEPTLLRLPPGQYQVEAQCEDPDGMRAMVMVPVIIQAGRTTRVHLQAPWSPQASFAQGDLVRMPNGQPVGWNAGRPELPWPSGPSANPR